MTDIDELFGAYRQRTEPSNWKLLASLSSEDQEYLAEIFQVQDLGFRVLRLKKVSGAPQWIGMWWSEATSSSITESENDARRLALEYVKRQ
jgi:hypothetical protein